MSLKLLQLNIFQGKFLPLIIDYVKQHDFDILQFQEVSGGTFSKGGLWSGPRELMTSANPDTVGVDCFATLKKELGYQGVLNTTVAKRADHASYFGNATFFKPSIKLVDMKETFLKPYLEKGEEYIAPQNMPRAVLTTVFSFSGKEYAFLNCHLAWGPDSKDEPHKVEQGKKLYEYAKSLSTPFILTGDFNVDKDSQVVKWIEGIARNLAAEKGITNTLNPNTHAAAHLFPPGLAVDFAFTSKDLTVTDFQLIDTPDLSDHLGLSLTIEV